MEDSLPLVSIITPSFNQGRFLEAAMRSVLEQDYPRLEYIVIDGGSSDDSLEIIGRHANRLAYWTSEPDAGQTEAINKGFARARGEVLAWLNSDDLLRPGAIAAAVEFLYAHPEVGMVYGDADYVDEMGKTVGHFPARRTSQRRLLQGYVHIPQQAAFFRAKLWRMVGPLDPTFYFAMDYDLWVRISALSPIRYIPRTWAGFRLHDAAKTLAARDRCWPEMIRVFRREGGGWFSILTVKYLLRRAAEPLMPTRLRLRLWAYARRASRQHQRDEGSSKSSAI